MFSLFNLLIMTLSMKQVFVFLEKKNMFGAKAVYETRETLWFIVVKANCVSNKRALLRHLIS